MNARVDSAGRDRSAGFQHGVWVRPRNRAVLEAGAPGRGVGAWAWLGRVLAALLLSAVSLWACSVPVFRFALEKWPADPFRAVVFHRGPLTDAQQKLARDFTAAGLAGRLHANVVLETVNADAPPSPELELLARKIGTNTLPCVFLLFPHVTRIAEPVGSGPLTDATVQAFLDSPARQELARRLGRGDSVVWVQLEGADAAQNVAAAQVLETRLGYLAKVLTLPKLDQQDIASGLVSAAAANLKLSFSGMRLARETAAERVFVRMLLGTEADLGGFGEPIVFPVFGRGRALFALIGKGIKHETIDDAASFLIGRCSCEVKEQNPGVDLLLAADWDALLKNQSTRTFAPTSAPQLVPGVPLPAAVAQPETVTISGSDNAAASASSAETTRPTGSVVLLLAAAALAGAVVVGIFLRPRK